MQRLGVSPWAEVRDIAREMHDACAAPPTCVWEAAQAEEPGSPTLAKYGEPHEQARQAMRARGLTDEQIEERLAGAGGERSGESH